MILQASFDTLSDPMMLTPGLAIIIMTFIGISVYTSLKYRSAYGILGVMLMIVALVASFISTLPLMWFWITMLLEMFILVIASITYTRQIVS